MTVYSRLLDAYQREDARIRGLVAAYVRRAWPTSSWRDADIDAFVASVVPLIAQGQLQIARLTDAHLRQVDELVFGLKRSVTSVDMREVSGAAVRAGVSPEQVYARAGISVYAALSEGKPLQQATQLGLQRALTLAATDLQLAKTTTAKVRFDQDRTITTYRRVLTGRESCALCSIASQHIYKRGDLMPIHAHCDCGVVPVRGTRNPAADINASRLITDPTAIDARLGAVADVELDSVAEARSDLDRIATHMHGEIGPVLTINGQRFSGPGDIAA